uniref:Putative membrane protein C20F1007 (Trinotate prediction) n=1 Tax=Henneguya salminicola TaxID=69463 RepID=A0A6G3MFZ8_HENSL
MPGNEEIINDFSCALNKDILVHGRLFIGLEYFYFSSKILGYETKVFEKWENVISVRKTKLAKVIPNAIRITTPNGDHNFASLAFRNLTYELILMAIKNQKEKLSMNAEDIKASVKKTMINTFNRSKDELFDSTNISISSLNVDILDDSCNSQTFARIQKFKNINLSTENISSKKEDGSPTIYSHLTPVINESTKGCCCKHLKRILTQKIFSVHIDDIFNALYDQSSVLMKNVYEKHKFQGICK